MARQIPINTDPYRSENGRPPKGNGSWRFAFNKKDAIQVVEINGPYGHACEAAIAEGKKCNAKIIYVIA